MALLSDKLPDNKLGKYYVDHECIDCDVCRETAPANFTRHDDNGYSYVYKQPETAGEEHLCQEAFETCPVEAIGDDGLSPLRILFPLALFPPLEQNN